MSFRTGRFGVVISVGSLIWLFVCMFAWFGFPRSRGTRELLERGCVSVLGWAVSLICSFNLLVALQLREPNFSPSSSRFWPPTTFLAAPSRPRVFFFWVSSWGEAGSLWHRLHRGPTVGIVSEPETIFTAALSGLPGNKASIDPPNEPTQQSLLLDLYLLKSGEEKSSSFSTFPGICRLIDCFARAVCIFWHAWDWKI